MNIETNTQIEKKQEGDAFGDIETETEKKQGVNVFGNIEIEIETEKKQKVNEFGNIETETHREDGMKDLRDNSSYKDSVNIKIRLPVERWV